MRTENAGSEKSAGKCKAIPPERAGRMMKQNDKYTDRAREAGMNEHRKTVVIGGVGTCLGDAEESDVSLFI